MGERGKRLMAELSTVVSDAGRPMPPLPPTELTDAQATVWRDVVSSLPAGWTFDGPRTIVLTTQTSVGALYSSWGQ